MLPASWARCLCLPRPRSAAMNTFTARCGNGGRLDIPTCCEMESHVEAQVKPMDQRVPSTWDVALVLGAMGAALQSVEAGLGAVVGNPSRIGVFMSA
jgi:hypothetical protein